MLSLLQPVINLSFFSVPWWISATINNHIFWSANYFSHFCLWGTFWFLTTFISALNRNRVLDKNILVFYYETAGTHLSNKLFLKIFHCFCLFPSLPPRQLNELIVRGKNRCFFSNLTDFSTLKCITLILQEVSEVPAVIIKTA